MSSIIGTPGDDSLVGTAGDDDIQGLGGNDTLGGGAGNDQLDGGDGDDLISGGAGDDTLYGGAGDDLMKGGDGNDIIHAGDGADYLSGGEGDDYLDGGFGFNRVSFNLAPTDVQVGVTVNLNWQGIAQDTGHGHDTLVNIQHVSGTIYDDVLTGDAQDNWLWGLGGNDTMYGGDGNDLMQVGAGKQTLNGDQGDDTVSFIDMTGIGVNVSLLKQGGYQDTGQGQMYLYDIENLSGSAYHDVLTGNDGDNRLAGAGGDDVLRGGNGDDYLMGDGAVTVGLPGQALANQILVDQDAGPNGYAGVDGDDQLFGGEGNDTLMGGGGNDLLHGGGGVDYALYTGNFSDYVITQSGVVITVADQRGPGHDGTDQLDGVEYLVFADKTVSLASMFALPETTVSDQLVVTRGIGSSLSASVLLANDIIQPGDAVTVTGVSNAVGGTVSLWNGVLTITTYGGPMTFDYTATGAGGSAVGHVSVSSVVTGSGSDVETPPTNIAAADLQGQDGNDYLYGTQGADHLVGGAGDDVLDGGAGADAMDGGLGNDLYYVDNTGDVVTDFAGGVDTVRSFLTFYTLTYGVENLIFVGQGLFHGTGNTFDNTIQGGVSNDVLEGLGGNDSLYGGDGNDYLVGGDGNDLMDGNAGDDAMEGGAGSDTYYVDSAGDTVIEQVNGGQDTIRATVGAYTMAANVETMIYDGAATFAGTGNAQDNVIIGGALNDLLYGLAGNDSLYGGGGQDYLDGGDGNDYISGDAGPDVMIGGNGNDTYVVDDPDDVELEAANGGYDTIRITTAANHAMGANVEVMIVTGTQNFSGAGNAQDNSIYGNVGNDTLSGMDGSDRLYGGGGADTLLGGNGNDILDGGAGADVMGGGAGSDTYYVDNAGDVVSEAANEGFDSVYASINAYTLLAEVENLTFTGTGDFSGTGNASANTIQGGGGNDTLIGLAGADTLQGGAGNDTLIGGAGIDTLTGGAGADTFVYQIVTDSFAATPDTITDFNHAEGDIIDLSAMDAVAGVAGNQDFNFIGTAAFSHTAGELRYSVANGVLTLQADVNGDGLADFAVKLTGVAALSAADIHP